jgi:hypothetical protein
MMTESSEPFDIRAYYWRKMRLELAQKREELAASGVTKWPNLPLHGDPKINDYLYKISIQFMGGELLEFCELYQLQDLLAHVVRDVDAYRSGGPLVVPDDV